MSVLPVLHHPLHLPDRPIRRATVPAVKTPAGYRRRLVLLMAAFTTAVEVASISGAVPNIPFGSLDLPLSIIPALGLAVACGERLLGRSTQRGAAIVYWLAICVLLPVLAVVYARDGRIELFTSLTVASMSEELVYRLAIPAVIGVVLRFVGLRPDRARVASLAFAGLWFVLLPGHREQMHSLGTALPFVAYAALAALIVYRSGSVLPMAVGHAVINLLTVLVWSESVAADARGTGLACTLGLLVLAYGRPKRITVADDGGLVDIRTGLDVASIDLRDGRPTSVTLSDGSSVVVQGPLPHEAPLPERTVR
ncbi:hypothetical protein KSP35_16265 [Aquihabitans sp. G128]|uniref:CPBP family glutamic-type intramembrane protease n=1 Tax=Aquihabitans sp. G128 TaxID=2849779 RepID=UPI001C24D030|nr:CPBP family glutamic-type intramembrane protease [Aquihabitans sp. G128]QXC59918.1 hypothetical protein KSP35_16265 [Aquihabitans sp. G128]